MEMGFRSLLHGVQRSQSSNAFIIGVKLCESVVELLFLLLS